jgi:tRNA (uracil-5-)-methyltransferase
MNYTTNPATSNKRVIAILDPPRAGVHSTVIKSVRDCSSIETVIFVACDAQQSSSNWIDLCRPTSNKYSGQPFQLVRVQGFDMFPQTTGFEMVLEFRRGKALKMGTVEAAVAAVAAPSIEI